MIIIEHDGLVIKKLFVDSNSVATPDFSIKKPLINHFYDVVEKYPNKIIVWYHTSLKNDINIDYISNNFKPYMMWSYATSPYLGDAIGYVEDSPFIKINKSVKYPTWLMSSNCGVIHSSQLIKFKKAVADNNLDFALNSIAKLGLPNGLWCYSTPHILSEPKNSKTNLASIYDLYKFIALHYKKRWIFLLFINLLIYEKRFTLLALLYGLMFKKRASNFKIAQINTNILDSEVNCSLDVIIPTMGRKEYLYSFLKDLKEQTHLPNTVIIVEQNPDETANSDLDYLSTEEWPFQIKHKFIHKTGACNARNIALDLVTSDYVFLADDDIETEDKALFQKVFNVLKKLDTKVVNLACLQLNEVDQTKEIRQWTAFGSGCSILESSILKNIKFNLAFEHGYGEDIDFGMQLRNIGEDVIYVPNLKLLHIKAPIGGFRSDNIKNTEKTGILPKPSPSIMLYRRLHTTQTQIDGYKTVLSLKYYKRQSKRNPISFLKLFKKQWKKSELLSQELKNKTN